LIILQLEFVYFGDKVVKEDIFLGFGIFVPDELSDIILRDFHIVIPVNTVKDELKYALVVHQTEDSDS
jgi:hypothetical protein